MLSIAVVRHAYQVMYITSPLRIPEPAQIAHFSLHHCRDKSILSTLLFGHLICHYLIIDTLCLGIQIHHNSSHGFTNIHVCFCISIIMAI